jgi:hypothetical protein
VVSLRKEVLIFLKKEKESLGASWERINSLFTNSLDLAISDPMLLQYFYMGLSKDSTQSLDLASTGAFLCLSISEARTVLDKIYGNTPCTSFHDELPKKEKKSSPDQEEKVLIAKSQSLRSQDLAINPEPSTPQNLNPPKKEEIQPLEISFQFKDDLFYADFGKGLNF